MGKFTMNNIQNKWFIGAYLASLVLIFNILQSVNAGEGKKNLKLSEEVDLASMLEVYATSFPEIHFILHSGDSAGEYMNDFYLMLGDGASNLDYEHPLQARDLLMRAQFDRIRLMLDEGSPSSTLFKAGTDSEFTRPYICLITLNESLFSGDPLASTRFIAGTNTDSDVSYLKILDNGSFIRFTFHHEVFHCLDAYINGPTRPMTKSKITGSYSDFRAEQRADLYAALMHKLDAQTRTSFLENMAGFRTLSLFNWDITHYTTAAINHALSIKKTAIMDMATAELLGFAMQQADQMVISRRSYSDFLATAAQMAMSMGVVEAYLAPEVLEILDNEIKADDQWNQLILQDIVSAENYISYH